jgi:hypothetical protein
MSDIKLICHSNLDEQTIEVVGFTKIKEALQRQSYFVQKCSEIVQKVHQMHFC